MPQRFPSQRPIAENPSIEGGLELTETRLQFTPGYAGQAGGHWARFGRAAQAFSSWLTVLRQVEHAIQANFLRRGDSERHDERIEAILRSPFPREHGVGIPERT
jgi:hypothetical protein